MKHAAALTPPHCVFILYTLYKKCIKLKKFRKRVVDNLSWLDMYVTFLQNDYVPVTKITSQISKLVHNSNCHHT